MPITIDSNSKFCNHLTLHVSTYILIMSQICPVIVAMNMINVIFRYIYYRLAVVNKLLNETETNFLVAPYWETSLELVSGSETITMRREN